MEQGAVIMTNKQNLVIEVTVNLGHVWTDHASVFSDTGIAALPNPKELLKLPNVLNGFNRKLCI